MVSSAPRLSAVQLELNPDHPGAPGIVGGGGGQGHRARHGLAGAVRLTPGAALSTVTVTGVEVVVLPAASRATAVSVWGPLGPRWCPTTRCRARWCPRGPGRLPSSRNCTPATPTLSVAVAVRVTVPDTVASLAGAVTLTVGAVVSALLTVTVTAAEVVVLPAASRATAVSVWGPLAAVVVSHDTL